jgi:hypothetical protein
MKKPINLQRWIATSGLILMMTITLSHYTNCAPPPAGAGVSEGPVAGVEGEVRIVDDWSDVNIAFMKKHQQVPEEAPAITLDGLCDRKSEGVIKWHIKGREEIAGEGVCSLGGFRIEVSDLELLDCGETYYLQATTESNESASIYLSRNCSG